MTEVDIRTDVPPPDKKRGRPKGAAAKPKVASQAKQLQVALDFVSCVSNNILPIGEYVSLRNNMAIVHSNYLSAGHPIVEELKLVPHLEKLKAALAKCGKTLQITETEGFSLSIKGENLRAIVPCHLEPIPENLPDAPTLQGNFNALKEAFKVCGTLANEKGERLIETSLLLEPNTCTGTNGYAMLQYWTGINTPPGTVVSKSFAASVAKQTKNITGLGATWDSEKGFAKSLTIWFEGGAWIKTQCYADRWPDIDSIINVGNPAATIETPANLFEAIDTVWHFCDGNRIYFLQDYVQSHKDANIGAQYNIEGLPGGFCFDGKLTKQIAPYATKLDFTTKPDRIFFYGGEQANPIRGVLMGMA